MIIYFLRHANAGETLKNPKKDNQRGLDPEGIQQCYQLARLFSRLQVVPDLIVTSPLKRAIQTAAMVANELGYDDKLRIEKCLRPEATWEEFRPMLKSYVNDTVIVVGHSPNLSQFVGRIIADAGHGADIDVRKGGVARVDFDGRNGELQWLLTPKLIREANAGVEIGQPPAHPPEVKKIKQKGGGKFGRLVDGSGPPKDDEQPVETAKPKKKNKKLPKKKGQASMERSRPKTSSK